MKLVVAAVGCPPTLLINSIAKRIERSITENKGEREGGVSASSSSTRGGMVFFDLKKKRKKKKTKKAR